MKSALVDLKVSEHIAWVTLCDPHGVNALSSEMMNALSGAMEQIKADTSCRVVVIQAKGRAFCVGHDLKEMQAAREAEDGGKASFEALFAACTDMMLKLRALPQVVIASVDGVATAAGCQLVAACDLAVATSKARFGVNGIDVALFCSTPMVAVSRTMHPRHAFELLVTGDFLDAQSAFSKGLINKVVPGDRLEAETAALASTIASKDPGAIAIGKKAFYEQLSEPLSAAYACGSKAIVNNLMLPQTDAAMAQFGKR
jgi:enoyl-CoA hydratase/carnithine racemase